MRSRRISAFTYAVVLVSCAQPERGAENEGARGVTAAGEAIALAEPALAAEPGDVTAPAAATAAPAVTQSSTTAVPTADAAEIEATPLDAREPNELGRIPILEYHLFGEEDGRWQRSYDSFRADLGLLYERGYRPITVAELVDKAIDLPAGLSPVVITFDDASPGQFRYFERDGELEIDPNSAVGIWLDFNRKHPDWSNKGVFCMLPAAEAGRSFFGNKGIEGQKSEWRLRKVRFLAEQGFELCNHTLWHANLKKYDDAKVQEQIARAVLAIDSAVAGYRVRTLALPLGEWPNQRELAQSGEWTDAKTGRTVRYHHDAILMVAGGPARSPHDTAFNALRLPRVQVYNQELRLVLDRLDRGQRYVSDGDPRTVARPKSETITTR